ncbi:hypothetical protein I4558_11485 [Proteus mirabilis]|nr:hypothetical protein [Proteus mirabilis]MBG2768010.1 hypothetical protein [Proteus mirabilis]
MSESDKENYKSLKEKLSKNYDWLSEGSITEDFNDYLKRFLNKENERLREESVRLNKKEKVIFYDINKMGNNNENTNSEDMDIILIDGTINPLSEISLVPIMVTN